MPTNISHLPYAETGYFSTLIKDYLAGNAALRDFYRFTPDLEGIDAAIGERKNFPVDRKLLADTLRQQYRGLEHTEATRHNLERLEQDNSFTICTAHQPNLATGYLYFIYKIVHAIKLAEILNTRHPGKHFIPVYYMGGEDNDLAELGTFHYGEQKFTWHADGQQGAVGRMSTKSLKPLLHDLFRLLGPPGSNTDALIQLLTEAYLHHETIATATQYLVHQLFGRYGLLVLDPDEPGFKKAMLPVLRDDLLHQNSFRLVQAQTERLSERYKTQAFPRPINLFYLHDQLRERIEKQGDKWTVVHTGREWTEPELLEELTAHPERFSPNVILRGILQESILPNVAFIGGGSEVAYWLQLKPLFEHYGVFFPPVLLRQSVLWIPAAYAALRKKLGLHHKDLLLPNADLIRLFITTHSAADWHTDAERGAIEQIMTSITQKATALDPTLEAAADATLTRIKKQLLRLEEKMYRAEKRKQEVQIRQIEKLKAALFPRGSLQERTENFMPWFIQYGPAYFDMLKEKMQPEKNEFLIIEAEG